MKLNLMNMILIYIKKSLVQATLANIYSRKIALITNLVQTKLTLPVCSKFKIYLHLTTRGNICLHFCTRLPLRKTLI